MKILRLLTCCLAFLTLLMLGSCSPNNNPDIPTGIEIEYETLTLRWNEVEGAKTYVVRIMSDKNESTEIKLSKNYYSLESLLPGEYRLTVGVGGSSADHTSFSESIMFDREEENGLEYRLINGTEYEVSDKGMASGIINVPATYRKKPVTAIGENAFFGDSDITEVHLPDSIRTIGAFAFANCSYLEKINLPNGLSKIGESSFSGCRELGGVISLPVGITELPKGAFAYCSSIEEIRFGENVSIIGESAFTDCYGLKALTLPSSLKSIGSFAFAACADVSQISFPSEIEYIGDFAFSKVMSLCSLVLPNSVKSIGKGAFYHCSELSSVELGNGVEKIGDSAFLETKVYNNSATNEIYIGDWLVALKDITALSLSIKDGTVGIADNALYGNQYITSIELPDSVKYIGSNSFAVSNIISIVIGSGIKHISDQAFLYCESLIDVVLGSYDYADMSLKESSLESIGNYAFMNCKQLARIQIPETVKDIGAYAFRNTDIFNSSLTGAVYADNWIVDFNKTITENVVVDKGTVGIARYAFYNCSDLKNIHIDNSVKYICKGAFYNCSALEKVIFPDTLRRIDDYAFYSCISLKLTSLPPMLREIGRSAFYMCGSADNYISDSDEDVLEIPSGVTYIGDFAFFGCGYRRADSISGKTETAGIDCIVIGEGVEYIGKRAFSNFASLKTVIIGGVEAIGDKAFYECGHLQSITISDSLSSIGDKAFYRCGELIAAYFPDTLLEIGDYAFYKCEKLQTVDLGKGLLSIGEYAFFSNTFLEDVNIPDTVVSIGSQAFRNCSSLDSLIIPEKTEYIGEHAFYFCDSLTLYSEHKTAPSEWSKEWNSSFVSVVWGCETAEDGYVTSVTVSDNSVSNKFMDTVLSAPKREGYVFLGLSVNKDSKTADIDLDRVSEIEKGTRLYTVWDIDIIE